MGILAPVRLPDLHAVPCLAGSTDQLTQTPALALMLPVAQAPPRIEQGHEPMHIRMLLDQRPVEPADFVVLAVSVVVAGLSAAHLVAHQDHGHAEREQRYGQEVLYLPVPQALDAQVAGRPLHAAVPAAVVVRPVAAVLAIRLIVLLAIGHKVAESESVMAGDEVEALLGFAFLMPVDIGAPHQPIRHPRYGTRFASEEVPDIVA